MDIAISPVWILLGISLALVLAGIIEFQLHQAVVNTIPIRIHVNGTRGKSSVTRLIAAGLRAGGIKTYAKTTGTAPRVIDPQGNDHIIHRLRSASIGEQVRLIRFFAREKPEAIAIECMAVQPHYQWIAEQQMIHSHIGVITNVRPDHLEEMGPTMDDITRSLGNTIPFSGQLVTADQQAYPIFQEIANHRKTEISLADETTVSLEELKRFAYLEHPQNVATALKVCTILGVDRAKALSGMVKVRPDLGALTVWKLKFDNSRLMFVNGMAANDPISTLHIWNFIIDRYPVEGSICIFLNTREDRPTRTRQMLQLVMENIKPDRLIVRGTKISAILSHLVHYSPGTDISIVSMESPEETTIEHIKSLPEDSMVYAIGNQVGMGQSILDKIKTYRSND